MSTSYLRFDHVSSVVGELGDDEAVPLEVCDRGHACSQTAEGPSMKDRK